MGIKEQMVSQGVKPRGPLGWVSAWLMILLSDTYCGDLAQLLRLQPEDEVLDVACGAGVFLKKGAGMARYVAGIDHSDLQLRMARKRNRERINAGTAEIVKGDSAALPWPDGRFSAVTCNCIGCFDHPSESIKEMFRVLRPGGRAAFSFDRYPDEASAHKAAEWWGLPTWTEKEALALVKKAGFSGATSSHTKNNLYVAAVKP